MFRDVDGVGVAVQAMRIVLVVIGGIALLGSLAALVFSDAYGPALQWVALLGTSLLLVGALSDRITSVKVSGTRLELELAQLGAPKAAKLLGRSEIGDLVATYAFLRSELNDRAIRVQLQDALVRQATALASTEKFPPEEVRTMLRDGAPVVRVIAIGLMLGDVSLADGGTLLDAVSRSRTPKEQTGALLVVERAWQSLMRADREALRSAIREDRFIPRNHDRKAIADRILDLPV
ncbi:hypothetical protein [Agromyces sp. SYSU T00194]|uniref:hypothetical protein n=1 Tax=Agromyces chitinivorans TaxID=3158560 RepID=UPI003397857C